MKVLITAGPTHEPIDPVRYIGNRSSGRMGAALAASALNAEHSVTLIVGPVTVPMPLKAQRVHVETAEQMLDATMMEFPKHDLLILAAAVADFRPKKVHAEKLARHGTLTIECETTADIAAEAAKVKKPHQRTIGFSLESDGNLDRARQKLIDKKLDLIVYNPLETISSETIEAVLIYPDGKTEKLPSSTKSKFTDILLDRAARLWR